LRDPGDSTASHSGSKGSASPVRLDRYWSELAEFLGKPGNPGRYTPRGPVVSHWSVQRTIPGVLEFGAIGDAEHLGCIVIHKGRIEQVPERLLARCFGRAQPIFANEVFVVFELSSSADPHVRTLEKRLDQRFADPALTVDTLLRRPAKQHLAAAPRVIAALQAPTLLNEWAKSSAWRLEVAKLGDHGGLAEANLLTAPMWDDDPAGIAAVLVSSHLQLENARSRFPNARKIWILHTGRAPAPPFPLIDGVIALSRRVIDLQRTRSSLLMTKPTWIIPPAYEASAIYRWHPDRAWTMNSRPSTRSPEPTALLDLTIALARQRGVEVTTYGQGTAAGFLDDEARLALQRASSCYVSPMPPWSGFGLAQHECFAAGTPVAGLIWGDLREEMPVPYDALCDDLDSLADRIKRLATDKGYANAISAAGLEYIRTCRTAARMNEAIADAVSAIAA
jgi:hypothetical protein